MHKVYEHEQKKEYILDVLIPLLVSQSLCTICKEWEVSFETLTL